MDDKIKIKFTDKNEFIADICKEILDNFLKDKKSQKFICLDFIDSRIVEILKNKNFSISIADDKNENEIIQKRNSIKIDEHLIILIDKKFSNLQSVLDFKKITDLDILNYIFDHLEIILEEKP